MKTVHVQRRYPRNQSQIGKRAATWHAADGSIPGFWTVDDTVPLVLTAAAFAAEWEVCK